MSEPKVWFISDTHFGEQPVRRQKLSGMSADELDACIVRKWCERVCGHDTVWHLGDIGRDWRQLEPLPGIKHLILAHASDRRPVIARSGIFTSIQPEQALALRDEQLFLVHDPDPHAAECREDIVHGHHHYRDPGPGRTSVCVDHIGWGPIVLDDLLRHRRALSGVMHPSVRAGG